MRNITLIGTFGLTDEQIAVRCGEAMSKKMPIPMMKKWEPCTMDGTLTDGGIFIPAAIPLWRTSGRIYSIDRGDSLRRS